MWSVASIGRYRWCADEYMVLMLLAAQLKVSGASFRKTMPLVERDSGIVFSIHCQPDGGAACALQRKLLALA